MPPTEVPPELAAVPTAADLKEQKIVTEVVFFYPEYRTNTPSAFHSTGWILEPDDHMTLFDDGSAIITIAKTSAKIAIRPSYLWREITERVVYVKRKTTQV